jgi:ribonuclease R
MHAFNECVKGMGLNLTLQEIEPEPRDVQKVLTAVKNRPMELVVNSILLRSMQKAKYYEAPLGHFGLALVDYCHFTSPIRRYPDLTIHRIIKLVLDGEMHGKTFNFYEDFVSRSAEQSSSRERLADEAERTVDDLKKAEYMTRFIGEEFVGFISGMSENGIFVQLENTVEGMIMMDDLPNDKYTYDEVRWMVVGKNNTFKIGQKVKIKVFSTDLITRKVNFVLAEDWQVKN